MEDMKSVWSTLTFSTVIPDVPVFGCRLSITCDKCGTNYVCDSSGKAGTREGNTVYIWGPCCEAYSCPDCYPEGRFKFTAKLLEFGKTDKNDNIYLDGIDFGLWDRINIGMIRHALSEWNFRV